MSLIHEALGNFKIPALVRAVFHPSSHPSNIIEVSPTFQDKPLSFTAADRVNLERYWYIAEHSSLPVPEHTHRLQSVLTRNTVETNLPSLGHDPLASQAKERLAILLQQGMVTPSELPEVARHYINLRPDVRTSDLSDDDVARLALREVRSNSNIK